MRQHVLTALGENPESDRCATMPHEAIAAWYATYAAIHAAHGVVLCCLSSDGTYQPMTPPYGACGQSLPDNMCLAIKGS